MRTEVGKDPKRAAFWLKKGEPVAFATETVYGLGAPLFSPKTVRKIFTLKKRPQDNPLIAHVASLEDALRLTEGLSPDFVLLAERFWPGPLTLVVPKKAEVPSLVSAGHPTVAIRMPSHPLALALLREMQEPLVAPSANLSGLPSPTTADDVVEDLGGKIRYVLDGGSCAIGIESTVLSLVSAPYTVLRPGEILPEEIEEALGKQIAFADAKTPCYSPGMKYRHYAPKAAIRLVYSEEELIGPFVLSRRPLSRIASRPLSAKCLYQAFREADRRGEEVIEVLCDPEVVKNGALMHRLLKAAAKEEEALLG